MKDKAIDLEDLSPMERILLDEEEVKLEEEGESLEICLEM